VVSATCTSRRRVAVLLWKREVVGAGSRGDARVLVERLCCVQGILHYHNAGDFPGAARRPRAPGRCAAGGLGPVH
jgi:hypothetical protein